MPADPGNSTEWCAPSARPYLLTAAVLASAMGFIDGSVVSIALPAIRADLGATLVQAQWVSNAYLLMLAALILSGGALADRYGLKLVFGGGIALFVVASMACAVAPDAQWLIAARVLQGVGAALMVPGSLTLISRAYPPEMRSAAIGTWAAASAVTTAMGPIIGSLVLTYGGDEMWRWIFAVNLPLGAIALLLLWRNAGRRPARATTSPDLIGSALAAAALFAMAWGLTGGAVEGAVSVTLNAPVWIGVGLALFAIFLWYEARHPDPMLPLVLFKSPVFSAVNTASFALYIALTAMLFFLPMAVIGGWGATPVDAALAFAPLSIFISTLSRTAGRALDRWGPGPVIGSGAGLVAVSFGWVALTAGASDYWRLTVPGMAFAGLGMAFVVGPLSTTVMNAVPAHRAGTASGVNNAVTRMSGVLAVAAMGSLAGWAYAMAQGPDSFGDIGSNPEHRIASSVGLAWVAGVSAAMAAIASLLCWVSLPRKQQEQNP